MIFSVHSFIPFIPLLPLAGAIINGLFGHRLPRALVSTIACSTIFVSFLISAWAFYTIVSEPSAAPLSSTLYSWLVVGHLSLNISFVVDQLSSIMILVVTGVGFLIHVYSVGYMADDPALARYFAYLNLFTFAMLTLVLGDSLPLMFLGWEGVGLCSYLLIGFWYTDLEKAKAGKKAFVVNRIGDFGFIVAMMLLFRVTDTLNIAGLKDFCQGQNLDVIVATAVCLMLFLGAAGKSAQLPLYVWLPDAMAGPTPVSALIHAATMVTAGVYMIARLNFLFAASPIAMLTVATIGAATAIFAATIGTAQNDIKKVLAYSTVSQLGFMFMAAGVGAYAIAIFHLATHAFFKACLFLGSGSVIHGMSGEQDIRQMGGLWKKQPITFATFFIATLAITGFPLTAGFMSKDAILWNIFASDSGAYAATFASAAKIIWLVGMIAAGLTAFYMWRLVLLTFFSGKIRASHDIAHHVHESPFSMTFPLVVLAILSLIGGLIGWPHILGGHEWISNFLTSVVGASPTPAGDHIKIEILLMSIAILTAAIGFLIAFFLYAKRIHPLTAQFASQRPWRWLYLRLVNKWHVDELYEETIIKPINWTSRVILYEGLDKRIIDATVNLVGWFAKSIGFLGQLFQSGNIQRYLAIFVIGLAILIYGWFTPSLATNSNDVDQAAAPSPAAAPYKSKGGTTP